MQDIYDRAKRIRLAAFDVDGVLTDGTFWWGPDGQEWKRFMEPPRALGVVAESATRENA